ncbi:hypothetical protein [Streptomyces sp. TRM68367]|uniref:hypothetical protein n=1 Tax=Streptomyces sp. TRM68367 TaxID=2758415 RepID=UPI00165AC93D|nr:hypothetical protein [Streptomyces sp. TRM68367]MBC9724936.1 hypothetical protein [Streptomyces sp. TRM68367]
MNATADRDPAETVHVVVAEVVHGPHAAPIFGEGLFCSVGCAGVGVYQLTHSISVSKQGAAFVLRRHGRPVGCVVTSSGQMWLVQALASHELPALG